MHSMTVGDARKRIEQAASEPPFSYRPATEVIDMAGRTPILTLHGYTHGGHPRPVTVHSIDLPAFRMADYPGVDPT